MAIRDRLKGLFRPEIEREISHFAVQFIIDLAEREKVRPLDFMLFSYAPRYHSALKRISLPREFIFYWVLHTEKAKKVARFSIAHEFGHYLQDLAGMPMLSDQAEREATQYAERATGVPLSEWKANLGYLIDLYKEYRPILGEFLGLKWKLKEAKT